MKPAHRSVMTPQPLSCVMHHVLLPSAPEHACHRVSSRAPLESSPRLKGVYVWGVGGAKGGDGSGLIRCLFNFSNSGRCHSATGVCWGGLSPPPPSPLWRHYGAERRRCDKGSSECRIGLCGTFIIDAVFLVIRTSFLHYAYEVHGECRGLAAEDENAPASVWTSCVWNIVCVWGGGLSTDMKVNVKISFSASDWSFGLSTDVSSTRQKQIRSTSTTTRTTMFILDHTSEIITVEWGSLANWTERYTGQMLSWHKYPLTVVYCLSSRGCTLVYVPECQYRCSTGKAFQRSLRSNFFINHHGWRLIIYRTGMK